MVQVFQRLHSQWAPATKASKGNFRGEPGCKARCLQLQWAGQGCSTRILIASPWKIICYESGISNSTELCKCNYRDDYLLYYHYGWYWWCLQKLKEDLAKTQQFFSDKVPNIYDIYKSWNARHKIDNRNCWLWTNLED